MRGEAGVAFAVKTTLVDKLEEFPIGINERLMSMRIPLAKGNYMTLTTRMEEPATKSFEFNENKSWGANGNQSVS
ncbi:Hypothetical predicted protein [Octopus vulgaris]|uniref:Uncharacterized protein n=1 Tax=Octopus vulgaris TaxID=6645 RepID=A0AA36AUI8_OCTVU|nr:Hypothetical predicted protein [Octopus vulgaris]